MRTNAISVANYFVDLAVRDGIELRQFGLMKRVYIAHGFHLAIFDVKDGLLDPRFDVVEAWKNGPVIPSVYHSFKHYRDKPITEGACIVEVGDNNFKYETPALKDKDARDIADAVWKRYLGKSDFDMIKLLHRDGTPWSLCYIEGVNNKIPDAYTKAFYKKLIEYGLLETER
jgi:uncharacterized phage-associated protein